MTTEKTSTAVEHLDTIIEDINRLISHKLDFNAFIIIVLGIEYLGNFADEKDFTEFKQSETRFKNGLDYFKDQRYHNNKDLLFKQLRGPLIHQYRPGNDIMLTSVCKQNAPIGDHFKTSSGKIIFVLEAFYEDFNVAIKRFKNIIKGQHNLNNDKLQSKYSTLQNIISPTTSNIYSSTATTYYHMSVKVGEALSRVERRKARRAKRKK